MLHTHQERVSASPCQNVLFIVTFFILVILAGTTWHLIMACLPVPGGQWSRASSPVLNRWFILTREEGGLIFRPLALPLCSPYIVLNPTHPKCSSRSRPRGVTASSCESRLPVNTRARIQSLPQEGSPGKGRTPDIRG